MQYEAGETTIVTFDTDKEVQALTWAASDMRRADPDNPLIVSAYASASMAYENSVSKREAPTFKGLQADAMVAVIKLWVEAGPPHPQGEITDDARAKGYKTACMIVSRTVNYPLDSSDA